MSLMLQMSGIIAFSASTSKVFPNSALSQGNLELKPADLPALHALSIVLSNIYPLSLLQNHISYNFKCDFLLGEDYVRALYQNLFTSFDPAVGLGALCGEGEKPQRPQHKMQKRF